MEKKVYFLSEKYPSQDICWSQFFNNKILDLDNLKLSNIGMSICLRYLVPVGLCKLPKTHTKTCTPEKVNTTIHQKQAGTA